MCPSTTYTLVASGPPGTAFTSWSFQGDFTSAWGDGFQGDVTTGIDFSGGQITVNGYNSCGSFSYSRTVGRDSNCPYYLTASDVEVYPNPAISEEITVEWPAKANVSSITLIDKKSHKHKVILPKENKAKFDLKNLKPGEYYLHLYVGEVVIPKKFLKK